MGGSEAVENEITLYSYLHDALVKQIEAGKYKYGESLPSYRKLCEIYNVGIRTVKDVIATLRVEKYIKTEERKDTIVIYKPEKPTGNIVAKNLLSRKESILDCIKARELLVVDASVYYLEAGNADSWINCRKEMEKLPGRSGKEKWRMISAFFQNIIATLNNPLLADLYVDMDLFVQVEILEGLQDPFVVMEGGMDDRFLALDGAFERRNLRSVEAILKGFYKEAYDSMSIYLEQVSRLYHDVGNIGQRSFEWNSEKGKVFIYTRIARDIISRIAGGEFEDMDFLPSIDELAKLYSASAYTIKESLTVLEEIGLVQVLRGVGTRVALENSKKIKLNIQDKTMKKDCMHFLCAVQFVAYSIKSAAALAVRDAGETDIEEYKECIDGAERGNIPMTGLEYVIRHLPSAVLKTIYEQIVKLLKWGLDAVMSRIDEDTLAKITDMHRNAVEAFSNKDYERFGDCISGAWMYILFLAKESLVRMGVTEAEEIVTPKSCPYNIA